jgi:hypothetical protein
VHHLTGRYRSPPRKTQCHGCLVAGTTTHGGFALAKCDPATLPRISLSLRGWASSRCASPLLGFEAEQAFGREQQADELEAARNAAPGEAAVSLAPKSGLSLGLAISAILVLRTKAIRVRRSEAHTLLIFFHRQLSDPQHGNRSNGYSRRTKDDTDDTYGCSDAASNCRCTGISPW